MQAHVEPVCRLWAPRPRRIVKPGGGTGLYTVLSGLRRRPEPLELTAIVAVTDDGGNNKVIRDEYGGLPPSDFRQALISLGVAEDPEDADADEVATLLRDLFTFRFPDGGTNGHDGPLAGWTGGNAILLFLRKMLEEKGVPTRSAEIQAIELASQLLRVKGRVIPVSESDVRLCAEYADGTKICGEHEIDEPPDGHDMHSRIIRLTTEPKAVMYPHAAQALRCADMAIAGPGDLYTSDICNMIVDGFSEALSESRLFVYIVNLMTKAGQTLGMTARDHVAEITKYAGRKPDFVLVNNGLFPTDMLRAYAENDEHPVIDDLPNDPTILRGDWMTRGFFQKPGGDILKRSLVRHGRDRLAAALVGLLQE